MIPSHRRLPFDLFYYRGPVDELGRPSDGRYRRLPTARPITIADRPPEASKYRSPSRRQSRKRVRTVAGPDRIGQGVDPELAEFALLSFSIAIFCEFWRGEKVPFEGCPRPAESIKRCYGKGME